MNEMILIPLIAETQILGAAEASMPSWVPIVIVAVLVLVAFIAFRMFSGKKVEPPKDVPPQDVVRPTKSLLDDRIELDAPVEITEGMSLAEIKRAKAAKIKGAKGRRETAMEATEKSRHEHEDTKPEPKDESSVVAVVASPAPAAEPDLPAVEEEDADDVGFGWDEMLDDEDDFGLSTPEKLVKEPVEKVEKVVKKAEKKADDAAKSAAEAAKEAQRAADEAQRVAEAALRAASDAKIAARKAQRAALHSEPQAKSLEDGLAKTRTGFINRLGNLFKKDMLDEDLVDEVEEILFTADIGTKAAQDILNAIDEGLKGDAKNDPTMVWSFVRSHVEAVLKAREEPLDLASRSPFVILVIGVNGVGKTTTIGKLASKYKNQGKKVMMVAGDTFRAAAVEQLAVWGDRTQIPVHRGESEADPASVIFSGVEQGVADGMDVIICDTAGRLHTKVNLLNELEKIGRVAGKVIPDAPHETILVLDANTGQNAIQQAKIFSEAVPITGIVLTKLDGTAKGGVILGICEELDAPIRYIGIGEGVADLREFDAAEFTEALFM